MQRNSTATTAQGRDLNPRNPLGCSYALIPERSFDLENPRDRTKLLGIESFDALLRRQ